MQNARLTYKEAVQELYRLKAWQISKGYACFREVANEPYKSLKVLGTEKRSAIIFGKAIRPRVSGNGQKNPKQI